MDVMRAAAIKPRAPQTGCHHLAYRLLLTIHLHGGNVAAGEIAERFHHSWP
jgi:hypothetical protein